MQVTGNRSEDRPLHNIRLMERFKELEKFVADDRETVIKLIDARSCLLSHWITIRLHNQPL